MNSTYFFGKLADAFYRANAIKPDAIDSTADLRIEKRFKVRCSERRSDTTANGLY